ncbi:phage tail assembly protein [Pseudomonas guariconensis]|uniref:phage tail assembly protein n=1 Tax=Pseudomonas TaxID=286 RepID=UPI0010BFB8C1|nr:MULTISPECIES: phage tail assembly protein [Pseudomonas]MCO7637560.1 phage tail assembly protein [Pseudomonas sp. S 311-6]MCO7515243.1 phage tail assembly protein [Pseudomonas putida]MCO7565029.1 phage tail assembly protein [Pseudomonas mosselii]MCO7604297.1 phage tail assembly protein [Pseudomonas guariconensis]MCO7616521.1 phage tail assembly protein [Pseudomonas guariconensis]
MSTTEANTVAATAEAKQLNDNQVELDTPIQRGKNEIGVITLRKPTAGELRGIHLSELLQMDVASLIKLIPRISELNEYEASRLDPADLVAVGVKVSGFLLQKRMKTDASLVA